MKVSSLEDYDKFQNALDRLENKFDFRFNQLEAQMIDLEHKLARLHGIMIASVIIYLIALGLILRHFLK